MKILARGAIAAACGFALLCAASFSLGGFQYEADVRRGYGPKVRWFRALGTASFIRKHRGNGDDELHGVYRLEKAFGRSFQMRQGLFGPVESFRIAEGTEYNIPVRARAPLSLPDLLSFDKEGRDFGRSLTAMVFWPPVMTTLPIAWSHSLPDWEVDPAAPERMMRRCPADCSVQFLACPSGAPRTLDLQAAPRATIEALLDGVSAGVRAFDAPDQIRTVDVPSGSLLRLVVQGNVPNGLLLKSTHCR